jgi:hypothetical protein
MPSCSLRHLIADGAVPEPGALRILAAWYREYAERTDNPVVWHARLATADLLEREAARQQERTNCYPYPDGAAARETASRQANEMFAEGAGR